MDLLLDTHAFIWWDTRDPRLDAAAYEAIGDADRVFVSAVSVWEISIKRRSGKLTFLHDTLDAVRRNAFDPLDITHRHADVAGALPLHHGDPFDRLLIAQAQIEGLVLVTQDRHLIPYGVPLLGMT